MLIVKGMHAINLHFWTYLSLSRGCNIKLQNQLVHKVLSMNENGCRAF